MARIEHPYQEMTGGRWFRGNLHTHTTHSDGTRDSQTVIDDYGKRGYDFLVISDHDIYTSLEDYAALDPRGMVLIPGNEITDNGPHLLHINGNGLIEPYEDRQKVIDEAGAEDEFIVVNHPNWKEDFNHCPQELIERWQGYKGLEIYNGAIERLHGSPYALDRWDMLLSEGRRLWGYANDDSHRPEDVELGWNVVYVKDISPDPIVAALMNGKFYASTGVVVSNIEVGDDYILIETENADRIAAFTNTGVRFAFVDDSSIKVAVPDKKCYVRFECFGRGGRCAWTQPFLISPE